MYFVVFCCALSAQETTGRVHAVIISGGMNKLMNHERYWNDCAFLYRTLRQDCRFARQDITLLISDGGEPKRDMLLADGSGFATSPADLDGDGERDVWLPATIAQIESSLNELAAQLTTNDHLFVFLMDHGGRDDNQQSYAWVWGGERLYDTRLAQLLDNFHVASIGIVVGMCYSGGFIEELQADNRVIVASCADNEQSWACRDKPYDEFVYHWTCAIAGHDPDGNAVIADTDGDGYVSMSEAFSYARQHDRREETPQYSSTPLALGQQWSLSKHWGSGISIIKGEWREERGEYKYYDLIGRAVAPPSVAERKYFKKQNAKQSLRPSPIIIIDHLSR